MRTEDPSHLLQPRSTPPVCDGHVRNAFQWCHQPRAKEACRRGDWQVAPLTAIQCMRDAAVNARSRSEKQISARATHLPLTWDVPRALSSECRAVRTAHRIGKVSFACFHLFTGCGAFQGGYSVFNNSFCSLLNIFVFLKWYIFKIF